MLRRTQEKGRAATRIADTGGYLGRDELYPSLPAMQLAGIDSAAVVRNVEERLLSSLWHGLPDSYDIAVADGLDDASRFAFPEHGELYRFLMCCGLHGFTDPRAEDVHAAFVAAFPNSALKYLDQFQRIRWATASSACVRTDARLVLVAARRRRRVHRLWRALANRIADPFGDARRSSTPIIVRRSARRITVCNRSN